MIHICLSVVLYFKPLFYPPKVQDLPREIQHLDTLTFLGCMSRLVVQLTVTSTSPDREPGYENKEFAGNDQKRFGSGFINSVDEQIVRFRCKRKNCPRNINDSGIFGSDSLSSPNLNSPSSTLNCDDNICLTNSPDTSSPQSNSRRASTSSITPSKKHNYYGGLTIHTNRQVIYDKSEADNAVVKFFYDSPDGEGVIEGHVGSIIGVNAFQDHIILHVMSHDKTLFQQVSKCLQDARSSYEQMIQSTLHMQQRFAKSASKSWVALISHPLGLPNILRLAMYKKKR